MQSKTSSSELRPHACFNAGLFRRDLSRFWPLWAVYAAVWLLALPMTQFAQLFGNSAQHFTAPQLAGNAIQSMMSISCDLGVWGGAIFGCMFAMALFSYLCSPRAVGMMHAFPIRREGLFWTNFLSGAVVLLAGQVLAFGLTAVMQGAAGILVWKYLLESLAAAAGTMFFFYSFACFCAMFTGQILAIPVFFAALNVLAAGVNYLVQNLLSQFLYGYSASGSPAWVIWLTPVWKLNRTLGVDGPWNDEIQTYEKLSISGLSAVAVYAAAGAALMILALVIYRRRRSEAAGDTVTVCWAKPLFRFGCGLCCGLSLGQLLYELLWTEFRSSGQSSLPAAAACMALAGLVGYYAAEMLLRKSFRVFRTGWKCAAAVAALLILLTVGIRVDAAGVENWVPSADSVASLDFSISGNSGLSGTLTDPESIRKFLSVHQTLIGEKTIQRQRGMENSLSEDTGYEYGYLSLNYTMKNGGCVSRNYSFYYTPEELQNPNSAAARAAALASEPDVQWAGLLNGTDQKTVEQNLTAGEMSWYDGQGNYQSTGFDQKTACTVFAALKKDVKAGRMGSYYFGGGNWQEEVYANNVSLYYSTGEDGRINTVSFQIPTDCTDLVDLLKKSGVDTPAHPLITQAQLDKLNDTGKDGTALSATAAVKG